jgi:hypothetical protein
MLLIYPSAPSQAVKEVEKPTKKRRIRRPKLTEEDQKRVQELAQGLLGENEEFLVYRWSLPSEATKVPTPSGASGLFCLSILDYFV